MKKFCLVIFFAVMLCIFTGCSKKPSQEGTAAADNAGQTVESNNAADKIDTNTIDDERLKRAIEKTQSSDNERRLRED